MTNEEAELYLEEELEDYDDYKEVTSRKITQQSRWSTFYAQVFQHKPTSTFWEICWSRGSTEQTDNGTEDVSVHEVEPVEVTTIQYKPKKKS